VRVFGRESGCTVPFGLFTQSVVIMWYHLTGHHPAVVHDRRDRTPWYTL
jgi:hypothetical protein